MFVLATVLAVPILLICLVWLSRHLMISREQRGSPPLSPISPGVEADAPRISVLLAAKDEQENIAPCVQSVLRQDYRDFELIVADDRSEDATGEILEGLAAADGRLKVIHIDRLPVGWAGKSHAMSQAAEAATGQWLCLIDADCRLVCRRTLSVAMRYACDRGIDLLSVLPVLKMETFWERVVQPVCGGVMIIWFKPEKVNDPASPKAYANGAFILVSRSAYERIGTHRAVKGKLMEDLHLAKRTKAAGLRLGVVRSSGLYTVRMYTSLGEILTGWSRIFFGTFGTLWRLIVSFLVVLVMGLAPYGLAVAGLALAAAGGEAASWWLLCGLVGVAACAIQLSVIYRYYKLTGACQRLAWTYPLGCVLTMAALAMAMTKHKKGAKLVWRNTTYSPGERL